MSERPEAEDLRTPVERRVARAFIDRSAHGQPLSRRARQTKRSVESYLAGGVMPRYMERLREIETGLAIERRRLERSYRALREACRGDAERFAERWHAIAHGWRFDHLNELIREHNEWYPIERDLPMDPRTRDYIPIAGRTYRRPQLGPEWVLTQFPAALPPGD